MEKNHFQREAKDYNRKQMPNSFLKNGKNLDRFQRSVLKFRPFSKSVQKFGPLSKSGLNFRPIVNSDQNFRLF